MDRINFNLRLDKHNSGLSINTENSISWEEAVLVIERKLQEIDERLIKNLMERKGGRGVL